MPERPDFGTARVAGPVFSVEWQEVVWHNGGVPFRQVPRDEIRIQGGLRGMAAFVVDANELSV